MLFYLVGVAFISAALGAVMAGGSAAVLRLFLLILIVFPAVVVLAVTAGLSAMWTILLCVVAVAALNLGWLAVVLVSNARRREAAMRSGQVSVNSQ